MLFDWPVWEQMMYVWHTHEWGLNVTPSGTECGVYLPSMGFRNSGQGIWDPCCHPWSIVSGSDLSTVYLIPPEVADNIPCKYLLLLHLFEIAPYKIRVSPNPPQRRLPRREKGQESYWHIQSYGYFFFFYHDPAGSLAVNKPWNITGASPEPRKTGYIFVLRSHPGLLCNSLYAVKFREYF